MEVIGLGLSDEHGEGFLVAYFRLWDVFDDALKNTFDVDFLVFEILYCPTVSSGCVIERIV